MGVNKTNVAKETNGNLAALVAKDYATQTTLATRLSESDFDTKTGSLTETAPATDTASSGLNGRLQRIAQRLTSLITALGTPFQAGGSIGNTAFIANAGTNLNTSLLALESGNLSTISGNTSLLVNSQASTTSGQKGVLDLTATTTAAPTYSDGTSNPMSTTLKGSVRMDTASLAGTAIDTNSGNKSAGTQRFVLATDQPTMTNAQPVTIAAPTTIYHAKKTVTTAGTRVALASSQAVRSVCIKALQTNGGYIYVGDVSTSSTTGFQLLAGDTISLDIANLSTIYIDSSVSGEGVTYISSN